MTIAALIDLGLEEDYLKTELSRLDLSGYSLIVRRSTRRGISGIRFDVEIEPGHGHRPYGEIRDMIEHSALQDPPKTTALAVFEALASAEARVHGVPKEDVVFHEVGAVDSIVDVVGTAVGIDRLGIEKIICSPLPLSRGFVKTCHGNIPTPAPATVELLKDVPVIGSSAGIELVTPTGAAIVKTLASEFGEYPSFVPEAVGYGLGTSDPEDFPNALRITLGREVESPVLSDRVGVLECGIDDLDPRILGAVMDRLLEEGALDVTFGAVQMKKNRPGILVNVLAAPDRIADLGRLLLTHTSTIGVRVSDVRRMTLPRRSKLVRTSLGEVRVKIIERPDGRMESRPEFDDARLIAERTGQTVRDVLRILDEELGKSANRS
jgi:uncharacterized protein (TIGR00299 family) protein